MFKNICFKILMAFVLPLLWMGQGDMTALAADVEYSKGSALEGKADAFVYDFPFNAVFVAINPSNKVVFLSEPFTQEPIAWAIRKNDPDFMRFLNDFLNRTKADGRFNQIYQKRKNGRPYLAIGHIWPNILGLHHISARTIILRIVHIFNHIKSIRLSNRTWHEN